MSSDHAQAGDGQEQAHEGLRLEGPDAGRRARTATSTGTLFWAAQAGRRHRRSGALIAASSRSRCSASARSSSSARRRGERDGPGEPAAAAGTRGVVSRRARLGARAVVAALGALARARGARPTPRSRARRPRAARPEDRAARGDVPLRRAGRGQLRRRPRLRRQGPRASTTTRSCTPAARGAEVAVGLRSGLADGAYTATYRVISADGHPVSGGFVFSIGTRAPGRRATVADLLSGSSAGPATEIAFGVARGVGYLAIALRARRPRVPLARAGGRRSSRGGRGRRLAARRRPRSPPARAGCCSSPSCSASSRARPGSSSQGATAGGTSFWSALDPRVVREVLGTRFGRDLGPAASSSGSSLGTVLAAGAGARDDPGAAARRGRRRRRRPGAVPGAGVLAALAIPAGARWRSRPPSAGTPRRRARSSLLFPLDVVHVLAMSVWIGGLVALLVRRARRDARARPARAHAPARGGARCASRRSRSPASSRSRSPASSRRSSTWAVARGAAGHAVRPRGAHQGRPARRRSSGSARSTASASCPACGGWPTAASRPAAAGRLLRRTLRGEVALVVVVLGVTVGARELRAAASRPRAGPVSKTTRMGPIEPPDDGRPRARRAPTRCTSTCSTRKTARRTRGRRS